MHMIFWKRKKEIKRETRHLRATQRHMVGNSFSDFVEKNIEKLATEEKNLAGEFDVCSFCKHKEKKCRECHTQKQGKKFKSFYDIKGNFFIACIECNRGRYGSSENKCVGGSDVRKHGYRMQGCFSGILVEKIKKAGTKNAETKTNS